MKPKVYIETSVISYLTARPSRDVVIAGRQEVTREWWEEHSTKFALYVSMLVMEEAKGGNPSAAKERVDAMSEIPVLQITDDAEKLAEKLISANLIPGESAEDALHIAIATINAMDFLLTWNFSHINNAFTKKKIIETVESLGYESPVICSPEELEDVS